MFRNILISIPLGRQHHRHKCALFSFLKRKYIKWRYRLSTKATRVFVTTAWLIISVFIVAFIFPSHLKQNISHEVDLSIVNDHYGLSDVLSSLSHNRIPPNLIDNTKQKFVYKTIRNWQLSSGDNVNMLPKLSSLRDPQWLRYSDNELFEWNEVEFNFVHERLKDLDIENQNETGYYTTSNSTYGDLGSQVILSGNLWEEARAKFNIHQINVVASNIMSLNRRLPEVRNSRCTTKHYRKRLPSASVIVIFYNEARSTVLRTVHSVINRSPTSLLKEVILVDDASNHEELLSSLDNYVKKLPLSVRVIRLTHRQGLIRARIAGANEAMGQVLIFLDSHIEVANGWLEPMLTEISSDRTRIILPVIDSIDFNTMAYVDLDPGGRTRGGIDWSFLWSPIEPDNRFENTSSEYDETDPFPSPMMPGGAFAVDRDFFYKSGSYDKDMMIWGGENVEMSVRVWLCGGSLLKLPCSHVGHIFREYSQNTNVLDRINQLRNVEDYPTANTNRFVEVWLEEYKTFYYYLKKGAKNIEMSGLEERKALRDNLQCLSFQWYLDNVYPDAPFPNQHHYFGPIRHPSSELCLVSKGNKPALSGMNVCHGLGVHQIMIFTRNMQIQNGVLCLEPIYNKKSNTSEACFVPCNFSTP